MRLVSIQDDGANRCGLVVGDEIIDLQTALSALGEACPDPGVRAFLERPDWREDALRIVSAGGNGDRLPLEQSSLAAAIANPRKIFVVGANTHSHLAEAAVFTQNTPPTRPMLLAKTPNAITGPHDTRETRAALGTRARRARPAAHRRWPRRPAPRARDAGT
jgi:2-keto-4-pentenoate hydratase/2-oxohepta-3-ene-1,7-dioic acid hydratase in catechol pathway